MVAIVLVGMGLAGCVPSDLPPPDSGWEPEGVNAANIAVMAADPTDLVHGRGSAGSVGREVVPAVVRLWHRQRLALPPSQLSSEAAGGAGAPPNPSPPPTPVTGQGE